MKYYFTETFEKVERGQEGKGLPWGSVILYPSKPFVFGLRIYRTTEILI